jgi:molybdopterin synthase catalytic subunit
MTYITHTPIDIAALFEKMHSPQSGGIVLFSGEVRNNHKGRDVLYLEYEAYEPMASKTIEKILQEAKSRWELNDAICIHRVGRLGISECAVVVITSSGHRAEAYDANRYIIDEVKSRVPVWKNEFFADGTSEWGANDCHCGERHEVRP